jgi:TRAP-type C4-dicarboxylate transport system substrate-binding protein
VTGTLSGNIAGWNEVAKSLYPMPLGWSITVEAVNLDTWNRLDPKLQQFLLDQFKSFEDKMWETVKRTTEEANNCNTNAQPCSFGKLAKISVESVKPEDEESRRRLLKDAVVPGWKERCGTECANEWSETVGKALGLDMPLP